MEPQDNSQTVEPSTGLAARLSRRLEAARWGRVVLGCTRWLVVFGLISSGYFGAAAVASGLRHAAPANQPILATAAPQK